MNNSVFGKNMENVSKTKEISSFYQLKKEEII